MYPIEIGAVGGLTQITGELALRAGRRGGSGRIGVASGIASSGVVGVGFAGRKCRWSGWW